MSNWVVVDPKRGIYINMDLVGALAVYEEYKDDSADNWNVGFFSRDDVNNEVAAGRFPDKESALDVARVAYITAMMGASSGVVYLDPKAKLHEVYFNG